MKKILENTLTSPILEEKLDDALESGALVAEFELTAGFSRKENFIKDVYDTFVSVLGEGGLNGKELWNTKHVREWLVKTYPKLYESNPEIFNIEENEQCKQ